MSIDSIVESLAALSPSDSTEIGVLIDQARVIYPQSLNLNIHVTFHDALKGIGGLVADDAYRTNNGQCFYVTEDGEPNCIIGVYLVSLGVPITAFKDGLTTCGLNVSNGAFFDVIIPELEGIGVTFDQDARRFLTVVQSHADNNAHGDCPWYLALAKGLRDL